MTRARGILWMIVPGVLVIGSIVALVALMGWFVAVPITLDMIPALIWIVIFSALGACALLEITKRLVYLRGFFHARQLKAWMRQRIHSAFAEEVDRPAHVTAEQAEQAFQDLMSLALGTAPRRLPPRRKASRNAFGVAQTEFLDAPTEQLAAQLSDLGELVLVSPEEHPRLTVVFTGRDAGAPWRWADEFSPPQHDRPVPEDTDDRMAALLNAALQRGIESFQIVVSQRWRRTMQLSAVVLAGLIGCTTVTLVPGAAVLPISLASLVIGGFLSWVIRDLSAGAARWRDR